MPQLTFLHLAHQELGSEEPWESLAKLTSLQQLRFFQISASGDPSPLSALTGLTSLYLESLKELEAAYGPPFTFSSLQPLSTWQQLEQLHLEGHACVATSLQGLAGLSGLRQLVLKPCAFEGRLKSLEEISPALTEVSIGLQLGLFNLSGIESCTNLEKLSMMNCGVSTLQPLIGLSSLKEVVGSHCGLTSLEGLNNMSLQSLSLTGCADLDR
jgi:Leucine-rich repeat (LRR) protein